MQSLDHSLTHSCTYSQTQSCTVIQGAPAAHSRQQERHIQCRRRYRSGRVHEPRGRRKILSPDPPAGRPQRRYRPRAVHRRRCKRGSAQQANRALPALRHEFPDVHGSRVGNHRRRHQCGEAAYTIIVRGEGYFHDPLAEGSDPSTVVAETGPLVGSQGQRVQGTNLVDPGVFPGGRRGGAHRPPHSSRARSRPVPAHVRSPRSAEVSPPMSFSPRGRPA
jgi:hypothetical protein